MIVTRLTGGLGSQMYQYAIGRCLAHRLNTELKLDINAYNSGFNVHHAFYRLDDFNTIENFATPEEIKSLQNINELQENQGFFVSEILDAKDNSYLTGFWQNEEYFQEIRDILLKDFTPKKNLSEPATNWQHKILSSTCAVSVHVRHGDYLNYFNKNYLGVLPINYYRSCVNELKKNFSDITLFIFSDDIEWCKKNFKFGLPMQFVTGCENDFEEMYLMSFCRHNINANSNFSWWGAWLNQNPNKKVFMPNPRFSRNFPNDGIVPKGWIKIPVDYSLAMPPMLSIIFYVEDNLSSINTSLNSIAMQNYPDYEIILVNTSADGSEKICRKFAGHPKLTILNCDSTADKFSAWNKGLDAARGDYVLFLTAKNFLVPDAVNMLYGIGHEFLTKLIANRETYLTVENYIHSLPAIICANKFLEEDAAGNSVINGMLDKKFSLKVDAALQNLNALNEINIPASQKLMTLATQGINNLVGTKFFK